MSIDRDMLAMARQAKAQRDAEGVVDERSDAVLALYEMGIAGFAGQDPIAILADPAAFGHKIKVSVVPEGGDSGVPRVRRGGEPASNQFGTFEVHNASPKQVAFVKRLLAERDLGDVKAPADIDTISKKAASALIDRLMGRPMKATSRGTTSGSVRLATDKQMAFLRNLISQRDYHSLGVEDRRRVDSVNSGRVPSAKGASELIEVLKGTAFDDRPTAKADALEAGVYVNPDGTVYRVYLGQQSGRMLAAKVEDNEFVYAGAAARFVTDASRKMTIEEAAAWGKTTGTCIVCARRLDVPESVDRGIGPVCYAKMGGSA